MHSLASAAPRCADRRPHQVCGRSFRPPSDLRRAGLQQLAGAAGPDAGGEDEAAHPALPKAPLPVQARAIDRAAKPMFVGARQNVGMMWVDIDKAGQATFDGFPTRTPYVSCLWDRGPVTDPGQDRRRGGMQRLNALWPGRGLWPAGPASRHRLEQVTAAGCPQPSGPAALPQAEISG